MAPTIKITTDSNRNFWVQKSGTHEAFETYVEAKAYAEELRSETGGAATILDLTDPARTGDD